MRTLLTAICMCVCVCALPASAFASDPETWYPMKEVQTSFGPAGTFIVDARGVNGLVTLPATGPEFLTLADFVNHMQTQFNALPVLKSGVVVGYELNVEVLGKPYYYKDGKFHEAEAVVLRMLGGESGTVKVAGIDICVHDGCLDPAQYTHRSIILPDDGGAVPPLYRVEGRLRTDTFSVPCSVIGPCETVLATGTTIEFDASYSPTEPAICYAPGPVPLPYPCTRDVPRDNYLWVDILASVDGTPIPGYAEAHDTDQVSVEVLLWEQKAVPPVYVSIQGVHYGESYTAGASDYDYTP